MLTADYTSNHERIKGELLHLAVESVPEDVGPRRAWSGAGGLLQFSLSQI
jgi:hypothetical protein